MTDSDDDGRGNMANQFLKSDSEDDSDSDDEEDKIRVLSAKDKR